MYTAMGEVLSVRVPKRLKAEIEELARLEGKDKSEVIREILAEGVRERRIRVALRLYSEGKVTLSRAAQLAGVSLWEIIDAMRKYGVTLQYGLEELEEDLRAALSNGER